MRKILSVTIEVDDSNGGRWVLSMPDTEIAAWMGRALSASGAKVTASIVDKKTLKPKRQVTATPWLVWQLAYDRATYGEDAGRFILATPDGETEHPAGVVFPNEVAAQLAADAWNARLQSLSEVDDDA